MSVLRPFLRDWLSVQILTARVRQESHKVTVPIQKVCGRPSDVLLACRYGKGGEKRGLRMSVNAWRQLRRRQIRGKEMQDGVKGE